MLHFLLFGHNRFHLANLKGKMRNTFSRTIRLGLLIIGCVTALLGYNFIHINRRQPDIKIQDKPRINYVTTVWPRDKPLNSTETRNINIDSNVVQIGDEVIRLIYEIQAKMKVVNSSAKTFNFSCTQKSRDKTEDLLCMVCMFVLCKKLYGRLCLTLSMLGNIFSRRHFELFFSYFSQNLNRFW